MKSTFLKLTENKIKYFTFIFLQYIYIIFINPIYMYLCRIRIIRPNNFHIPKGGVLLISNHQSKFDPFAITCGVGMKNFVNSICPTRYPVTSEYMRRPFLGRVISLIGGYDIGDTTVERMKKLLYTRELLVAKKQNVLIFPEGKINRTIDLSTEEFQKGVEILFRNNIPIIFVRLTNLNTITWLNFFKKTEKTIRYSNILINATSEEKMNKMIEFYK